MIATVARQMFQAALLMLPVTAVYGQVEIDAERVAEARQAFIDNVVSEHGFERSEVTDMLEGATISARVLELISRPAERVVPWYEYREIFLNESRIESGVEFWQDNAVALAVMAENHGVEPHIIVATIGIETLFGQRMGAIPVLDALSTLAFAYPPRSAFFSGELESLLLLSREEGAELLDASGSYAGAMGAGQFIPSSYRAYAVDGNGDGRRDLWNDWDDILASVANYYGVHGWQTGEPVAVEATRPADWSGAEPGGGLDLDATVGSLRALGYEFEVDLPDDAPARVFAMERDADSFEYWVGFQNFYVITRYNRSSKYALAAHQLGQAILNAYEASAESGR